VELSKTIPLMYSYFLKILADIGKNEYFCGENDGFFLPIEQWNLSQ
jgi:hypothetical protein